VSGKIGGVDGTPAGSVGTKSTVQRRSGAGGAGALTSTSEPSERVQITDTATQLASLEQAALALPAVDEARVSAIRGAIEQGSYTVSSTHIADKLVSMEQMLGSIGSSN
jgi:negative regulator of flagellin synthesis FlgM